MNREFKDFVFSSVPRILQNFCHQNINSRQLNAQAEKWLKIIN